MFSDSSAEVHFEGLIRGASRDDVFRVVEQVARRHRGHRVMPAGDHSVMVRHVQQSPLIAWLLLGWWAFFGEADDSLVVITRPEPGGTHVDIAGTGSSAYVDQLGDALDELSAGSST